MIGLVGTHGHLKYSQLKWDISVNTDVRVHIRKLARLRTSVYYR